MSTFGKVIKRGWDWLGLAPAGAERIGGLIEVPGLAESLTLNTADFIRAGARGAVYLAYRKAIQEAVAAQLSVWGEAGAAGERARRRAAPPAPEETDEGAAAAEAAPRAPEPAGEEPAPAGPEARPPRGDTLGRMATGPLVRRPARYGLNIQFEARPDDPELGLERRRSGRRR